MNFKKGLKLNKEQDGYGYFYGVYDLGGGHFMQVNILPPSHSSTGRYEPYVDGATLEAEPDMPSAIIAVNEYCEGNGK